MSDEIPGPDSLADSRRHRAATARLAAPDWIFSAVIHLLLVMLLVTSKAGPGGGFGDGSGGNGDGGSEFPGDAWIEAQMGFDSGESSPAQLNPRVFETADPLALPPVATPAPDEPAEQTPAEIRQAGLNSSTENSRVVPAVVAPETVTPSSAAGASSSGGAASGNGQEQGSGGGGDRSPGEGGDGQGGTSLFGIWDRGERIVYVIDRSSSMQHYDKLKAARSELESSLARLEASIEFQVLLYNQQVQPLNVRGSQGLVRATVTNKNLILRQSQVVLPDGGTQHLAALQAALRLKPTVVYFLTDAEEPGLTASQISTTARQLAGATRIHCIQFGEIPGAGPTAGNWLQQLAQATGGKYVHVRTDALRQADGDSRTTR